MAEKFENAPLFQMSIANAEFVYHEEVEDKMVTQPVEEVFSVGTLVDDSSDDLDHEENMNLTENFVIFDPLTKASLTIYRSDVDDCKFVVQIDTTECEDDPRIRVNVNDDAVYDGHAESGETYPLD